MTEREKAREYMREWYSNNREKWNEYTRNYYATTPGFRKKKLRAMQRYNDDHREELRKKWREYSYKRYHTNTRDKP